MLTLFRRIRQKLIDSGSVTKYLLYATGEILLVVIGILIALQVNNWNVERIERQSEVTLLKQLQSDLSVSGESIDELYSRLEISSTSADSLLHSFRTDQQVQGFVFHASLVHRRFFFNPAYSGYTQLGNASGFTIRNSELRNQVVEIYEGEFEEIKKRQRLLTDHMNDHLFPLSKTRFNLNRRISFRMSNFDENSMDFYEPLNFESLASDTEFANTIVVLKRLYSIQLNQLDKTSTQIRDVLTLLNDELEDLN